MNCFQVCKRLLGYFCILAFLFCWCGVISVRSNYTHFRIILWVVTRDQVQWPAFLPTPFPLPFTTENVLITFFCSEEILYPQIYLVCCTSEATKFSSMRFSWLVNYEADYRSSNFSLSNWEDMKSWSWQGVPVSAELVFGYTKPVYIATIAGNTCVEPFILEYVNITCSIQVVHRIQVWMEEKLQTYVKKDTECLHHNMWMISCMIISYYCFLMAFIVQ